jgi:competence protein ComEC
MYWSARPFVRIVIFLIAGIYSYYSLETIRQIPESVLYALSAFLLFASYFLLKQKLDLTYNPWKGVIIGALIITTGWLISSLNYPEIPEDQVLHGSFLGNVVSQPAETEQTIKTVLKIRQRRSDTSLKSPFKALVYFRKGGKNIEYGDNVLFYGTLTTPLPPRNPGEFNYKKFLEYKGIVMTGFVDAGAYLITGRHPENPVKAFALKIRSNLLKALKQNGLSGNEFAVAAAVILGYDDVMDDNIRLSYQKAGAMHVLCVSGLHVGIVYLVMNFLLGFLRRTKKQKMIKMAVLLIIVWFYAFLTGLSPSVLRATVMVSFFIIGNEIKRDKDAYNTLAMSAFFLLIYNPAFLFDVGFQLSYAAVLGIITFYNPIYRSIWIRNKMINKLWSVIAVSLAAQLGTFPLAAHYFHTFPVYFILTNLIIFPFSFLIISGGLLFIFISWIPVINQITGAMLSGMIYIMNLLVGKISELPLAAVTDLYFSWLKVAIVYSVITAVFVLLYYKQKKFVIISLTTILAFTTFETIRRFNILNRRTITIYDLGKKGNAIDLISGKDHFLINDLNNEQVRQIEYYIENHRIENGLRKEYVNFNGTLSGKASWAILTAADFIEYNGIRVVRPSMEYYKTPEKFSTDLLWITGQCPGSVISRLTGTFDFKRVIIGSSVPKSTAEKLKKILNSESISYYDIREKGCFILNLSEK